MQCPNQEMCSNLNCNQPADGDGVSGMCFGCSNEDPDGDWNWCYHHEPEPGPYSPVTAIDTDTDSTYIESHGHMWVNVLQTLEASAGGW